MLGKGLLCAFVIDGDHPEKSIVVEQRFCQHGGVCGVLDRAGMCVRRGLVVIDDHPHPPMSNSPRNPLIQSEAHLPHPFLLTMPCLGDENLLLVVPEIDDA